MSSHVMVVFTNPVTGQEAEFNDWYDNVHLNDLLKVTGVVAAQRFKAEAAQKGAPAGYLTVYEIDGDPQVMRKELGERMASGEFKMTSALDASSVAMWTFKAHGERHTAS